VCRGQSDFFDESDEPLDPALESEPELFEPLESVEPVEPVEPVELFRP